jgi:hypothetical protein
LYSGPEGEPEGQFETPLQVADQMEIDIPAENVTGNPDDPSGGDSDDDSGSSDGGDKESDDETSGSVAPPQQGDPLQQAPPKQAVPVEVRPVPFQLEQCPAGFIKLRANVGNAILSFTNDNTLITGSTQARLFILPVTISENAEEIKTTFQEAFGLSHKDLSLELHDTFLAVEHFTRKYKKRTVADQAKISGSGHETQKPKIAVLGIRPDIARIQLRLQAINPMLFKTHKRVFEDRVVVEEGALGVYVRLAKRSPMHLQSSSIVPKTPIKLLAATTVVVSLARQVANFHDGKYPLQTEADVRCFEEIIDQQVGINQITNKNQLLLEALKALCSKPFKSLSAAEAGIYVGTWLQQRIPSWCREEMASKPVANLYQNSSKQNTYGYPSYNSYKSTPNANYYGKGQKGGSSSGQGAHRSSWSKPY